MGNQQDGARIFGQGAFQLLLGIHVQVIGRFVENQPVVLPVHDHGQADLGVFTAGKNTHLTGDVVIGQINVVPTAWGNPTEGFEHVYKHEQYVSELIDKMVDIAAEDKDHASTDFLFGFVREQVEEESTARKIVDELKNYGECHIGILDHKLGKR